MLAQQRQAAIVARVRSDGAVRVADLVADLGVSDMTIRRDLEALAERGLLAKVHGGATVVQPGLHRRARLRRQGGPAAGRRSSPSPPGPPPWSSPASAIALSAGTTTAELARRLVDVPGLTVVTNSVPVADCFYRADRPDRTVVLTGGERTPSDALVGPIAVAAIRHPAPGRALPRRARDERAGRLHHAEPDGVRHQPGPGRRRRAAGRAGRQHQVGHRRHLLDRRPGPRPTCSSPTPASPTRPASCWRDHGRRADRGRGRRHEAHRHPDGRRPRAHLLRRGRPTACAALPDRRELPPPPPASQLRYDPLVDEWVAVAAHRQTRTFLPPADECPLCPSTPDRPDRDPRPRLRRGRLREPVPVVQPAGGRGRGADLLPPLNPVRPGAGPVRGGLLHLRPRRLVRHAVRRRGCAPCSTCWPTGPPSCPRSPGVEQVFCFENRGVEIGVTLHHPHGQIYALPVRHAAHPGRCSRAAAPARRRAPARNLFADVLAAEREAKDRVVAAQRALDRVRAGRGPLAVRGACSRRTARCRTCPALSDAERDAFGAALPRRAAPPRRACSTRRCRTSRPGTRRPCGSDRDLAYLHLQLFSIRRAAGQAQVPGRLRVGDGRLRQRRRCPRRRPARCARRA